MVGDFIIRKHSARTADARLTPLAHSLCSYARFRSTSAFASTSLVVRHAHSARTLTSLAYSLRSIIRTLPMVARGDARTADATLTLPRSLLLAHSLCSHARPTLPLVARAFQAVSLCSDLKTHKDLSYHSY